MPTPRQVQPVPATAESHPTAAKVEIYDTTLRDGSQLEGISLTVDDKLAIARQLDWLGVDYIEAGWPGANPKDDEFFRRARTELHLEHSTLVAFGATRRAGSHAAQDDALGHLLDAATPVVCIVGKCWDYHVTETLGTTLDEGIAMVADSVEFLTNAGREVFFDAEHFFDDYKRTPGFSLRVLEAAAHHGATRLVLCDTNGGTLPHEVERIVREVVTHFSSPATPEATIAVHLHDDAGTGVANALAGVRAGATQVQGTINGYGERTGNCNLTTIIPNLTVKMGIETLPADRLERLAPVAHHVAELVNMALSPQAPYVGEAAATLDAAERAEHLSPGVTGVIKNPLRETSSGRSTTATLLTRARGLGIKLLPAQATAIAETLTAMERDGYHFEVAPASLELLMRQATGWTQPWFTVESYQVITDASVIEQQVARAGASLHTTALTTEATVKVRLDTERYVITAEGNGPVNALDVALRAALTHRYPHLASVRLADYKVRVLHTARGTAAATRVLITSTDGERTWTTMAVGENIIKASWQALTDALVYGLLHASTCSQ